MSSLTWNSKSYLTRSTETQDGGTFVISPDYYQDVPYFLLGLLVVNLLPTWTLIWVTGKNIVELTSDMKKYSEKENTNRTNRILWHFKNEQSSITNQYLIQLLCEVLGLALAVWQLIYLDSFFHHGYWHMAQQTFACKTFFPQESKCLLSDFGYNKHEELSQYLCLLTMNRFYCRAFVLMGMFYIINIMLYLMSTTRQMLFFIPAFRR